MAPSWMYDAISFMRSVPASFLPMICVLTNANTSARIAAPGTPHVTSCVKFSLFTFRLLFLFGPEQAVAKTHRSLASLGQIRPKGVDSDIQ